MVAPLNPPYDQSVNHGFRHQGIMTRSRGVALVALLALAGVAARLPAAQVVYVRAGAPAGGDGSSWPKAFADLQAGINAAAALATPVNPAQVWVAAGTYRPSSWPNGGAEEREKHFSLRNHVTVYGGFPAAGDPPFTDRDPATHITVLSGDLGVPGDRSDNCYHVLRHPAAAALDGTAVLDGVTITAGQADGATPHNVGGGVYNRTSAPTFTGCILSDNRAEFGGGAYQFLSSAAFTACTFADNEATASGGGVHNHNSTPTFTACAFIGNRAALYGGGARNQSSAATFTSCTFTANTTSTDGGGVHTSDTGATFIACAFTNNRADGRGGGAHNLSAPSVFTSCTLVGNSTAGFGGGLLNDAAAATVTASIFAGNRAAYGGGMAIVSGGAPAVENTLFSGNAADALGGAVHVSQASPRLINCTLGGNTAPRGGALFCDDGAGLVTRLENCIAARNSSGIERFGEAVVELRHSCVHHPEGEYNFRGMADPTGVDGNLAADPLFANPDFGNWRPQPESPVVDAGDDGVVTAAADLDGESRIQGARVDMGAYESDGSPRPTAPPAVIHVRTTGHDGADGLSWATAKASVQAGIDTAAAGGGGEVWVASGTYAGRIDVPVLVHVYGGFSGSEINRGERDWQAHETVLDGGAAGTVASFTDSAYRLCGLDGLTITNGMATDGGGIRCVDASPQLANLLITNNIADDRGGGMFTSGSNLLMTACTFAQNQAVTGAGLFTTGMSPAFVACLLTDNTASNRGGGAEATVSAARFDSCTFSDNQAATSGGGMTAASNTTVAVHRCVFSGNRASYGAGAHTQGATPAFTNCTFSDNVATVDGGGMYNNAGAPAFTACDFSGNRADGSGGGTYNWGGEAVFTACTFAGNQASDGGGARNIPFGLPITFTACVFSGNQATRSGGGLHSSGDRTDVTGCTFNGNQAQDGGAMYAIGGAHRMTNTVFHANTATSGGGAACCVHSSPTFANCTFGYNRAPDGGALLITGEAAHTARLTNCIVAFNNSGIRRLGEIAVTVTHGCVYQPDGAYDFSGVDDPTGANGNLRADPGFVDQTGGNYRLVSGSPCIDAGLGDPAAGVPDTDSAGNPRYDDLGMPNTGSGAPLFVDMGAYERQTDSDTVLAGFRWGAIASPQTAAVPFPAEILACNAAGERIANYAGEVTVTAAGAGGALPVTVAAAVLSAGRWVDVAAVGAVDTGVRLTADDGAGHSGQSTVFDVGYGPLHHFAWAAVASPQQVNVPFPVTVTARDANGFLVAHFAGQVNLGGGTGEVRTERILGGTTHTMEGVTNSTLGYRFRPNRPLVVTHLRHYFGTKVSIWTDAGTLLVAKPVSRSDGGWVETALASPVVLAAGETYRVAAFADNGAYHWRTDLGAGSADGTILRGCEIDGDGFPANDSAVSIRYWLVDLVYESQDVTPVSVLPAISGSFVGGSWTGEVTVTEAAEQMHLQASQPGVFTGRGNPFDVLRREQTIAFDPIPEKTYGDAPFAVSATASSGLPVTLTSSNPAVATVAAARSGEWTVTVRGAGETVLTATQGGNGEWAPAPAQGRTLQVARRGAAVAADGRTKAYGEADPPLTYTVLIPPVAGDAFAGALTRDPGEDAGVYAITQGTLTLGANYNLIVNAGTLTIGKAAATVTLSDLDHVYDRTAKAATATTVPPGLPVVITYDGGAVLPVNAGTYAVLAVVNDPNHAGQAAGEMVIARRGAAVAADLQTKTYGEADPSLTYTVLIPPVAGDAFDGALTRDPGEDAGVYAITQGTLTLGPNYDLTVTPGTLTIGKAPATVVLGSLGHVYDRTAKATTATTVPPGLPVVITYDGGAVLPVNAGTYAVLAVVGDPNHAGQAAGELVIARRPASVAADYQAKLLGEADPPLTYTVLIPPVAGDAFAGALTRDLGEDAGVYAITQGTLTLGANYDLTVTPATLTVGKAPATAVLGNLGHVYDRTGKAATATTIPPGLPVVITYDGGAVPPVNAGIYAVLAVVNDPNHAGQAAGELVIARRPASVAADYQAKLLGEADPPLTYTVLIPPVAGDAFAGALTRDPGEDAGVYAITQGTLTLGANYDLTVTPATLTVGKAPATVVLDNLGHVYDRTGKAATATTVPPGLPVVITYGGSAVLPVNAGTYAVLAVVDDPDHAGQAAGELVITRRPASVAAAALAKTYGEADPPLTYTVLVPPVAGDAFTGTLTRDPGEDAGVYAIAQGTLTLGPNYDLTVTPGTLTITEAAPIDVPPHGDFATVFPNPANPAGRRIWDFSGPYQADLGGYVLDLLLEHDAKGGLTGNGRFHGILLSGTPIDVPLTVKGKAAAKAGAVTATLSLGGKQGTSSVKLKLSLVLDGGNLAGVYAGSVADKAGGKEPLAGRCALPLVPAMDGTFEIDLHLVQNAKGQVGGHGVLTLANGRSVALLLKGKPAAGTLALQMTGDKATDALAGAVKLKATLRTRSNGTAECSALTGKAFGQTLAWP